MYIGDNKMIMTALRSCVIVCIEFAIFFTYIACVFTSCEEAQLRCGYSIWIIIITLFVGDHIQDDRLELR